MRVSLIFALLFSAANCASLVHQPGNEYNILKELDSLSFQESKDVGPEKLNRWFAKVEVIDECSNTTYTDPNGGNISSPNYPGNYSTDLSCTYLIDLRTSSAESILLTFLDFRTEYIYDPVNVYDGSSVNDPLLLSLTGSEIPGPVQSSTAQMLVTFTTDRSNSYRGFLAEYSNGGPPGCGRTYTEMTGNISTLNYPLNYVNNLDCQYSINLSSSGASSITLTFLEFETETFFDLVYVYEGLTTSGELLLEMGGSFIPRPVVSKTGQMLVRFISDQNGVGKGFLATYTGV